MILFCLSRWIIKKSSKLNQFTASPKMPQWSSAPASINLKPCLPSRKAAAWSAKSHKSSEVSSEPTIKTKITPFPRLPIIRLSLNHPEWNQVRIKTNHSSNPVNLSQAKLLASLKMLIVRQRLELSVKCKLTMIGKWMAMQLSFIWRRLLLTPFW